MPRAKPILLRILLAGVIGAVVTVGVAVGCAMSVHRNLIAVESPMAWKDPSSGEGFGWRCLMRNWTGQIGMQEDLGPWPENVSSHDVIVDHCPFPLELASQNPELLVTFIRTAGWPFECVWGGVTTTTRGRVTVRAANIGRPLDIDDRRGVYGQLPIAPIWSGLAINTLFYGTIAWGLLFLPGTVRRWRRRRGGRCRECGYDRARLAAGAACPECGSP